MQPRARESQPPGVIVRLMGGPLQSPLRPVVEWIAALLLSLTALIGLGWSAVAADEIATRDGCSPELNFDIVASRTVSATWWPPETVCRFTTATGLSPSSYQERRRHWGLYIGALVGCSAAAAVIVVVKRRTRRGTSGAGEPGLQRR